MIPSSYIEMDNSIMMNLLDTIRHDLRKESGKGGNDLDLSTSTLFKDGKWSNVSYFILSTGSQ